MMQGPIMPQDGESLDGFLRRVSETDFWADVADYLGQAGLRYGHRMVADLDVVEGNLGLEPGSLEAITPRWKSAKPVLNWRFERHHAAPVCPACIAEGRPHHQAWRHAFVTACTVHGLILEDQCPMCCEPLLPGKGGYDVCACGGPLQYLEQHAASEADLALSALIGCEMHPSRACLPPALAFQTPSDIGEFLFFLAASGLMARTGKQGKTSLPKTVEEARCFLSAATGLLCDWPNAFRQDVSDRLQRSDSGLSTAPERLGRWYQRLMRFTHPAYDDFRTELGQVVSAEFDGTYAGACGQEIHGLRDWVPAAEAARLIGIRPDRIVDAVANDEIEGKLYSRGFGHRQTAIHRTTIETIRANRDRFADKKALRHFLGVSRKQYDLLRDAGVMVSIFVADRPPLVDGDHDLEAARAAVARLAERAIAIDGETLPLKAINLRFTTDRVGVLAVLRAMRDGDLQPALGSTSGKLAAFEFDRESVDEILHQTLRGSGFTVQETARITGWKEQCIAHWCDLRLIDHEAYPHGRGKVRVIHQDSLASFQARFVPLASLAKQAGTSSRKLMAALADRGIDTVGAMQEGSAWRGHLVPLAALASASLVSSAPSSAKEKAACMADLSKACSARSRGQPRMGRG